MLFLMALATISFSPDPGKILDFTGHSPASIFNDAILPRINSFMDLLPQDPGGLEEAAQRREAQLAQDLDVESAFRQEDEDFFANLRQPAAAPGQLEAEASVDYDAPISMGSPQQQQSQGYKSPAASLVGFVKEFEGFNPKAYGDFKQTSIGYGTRARKGETTISREEAEARLGEELSKARSHVEQVNKKHGYNFAPNELDALTSFAYNVGNINQLTAGGTRKRDEIARKMLEYNKAGGKPLRGLTRRRQAESTLFTQGY